MKSKNYSMRVNVYKTASGYTGYVTLCEEALSMFNGKQYVSISRMQNRLAFVPHDYKSGRGEVSIRNSRIQFGMQSDCEMLQDFCGEYDTINRTETGVVFIKLEDKRGYDNVGAVQSGIPHKSTSRKAVKSEEPKVVKKQPTMSLADMLQTAVDHAKEELRKLESERIAISKRLEQIARLQAQTNDAITAYQLALSVAKGEQ